MKVTINGEQKEIPENSTISQVLESMNIKSSMLVVEQNLNIVDKKNYATTPINDGDTLEIVGFFGGG